MKKSEQSLWPDIEGIERLWKPSKDLTEWHFDKPKSMNQKQNKTRNEATVRVRVPLYLDNRITGKAVEANHTRSRVVRDILAKALDKV